jgi:hypothetical protein
MARNGNGQITGNELQAMVNEGLLGLKPGQSIPATNRCLTRKEVVDRVYVYSGLADCCPGAYIPYSSWTENGINYVGPSPNYTTRYSDIAPIGASSILFEMDQVGYPGYLNVDLGGYVNGSPLRLDPGNGLDWLYFGGPQYSPQMSSYVKVGNNVYIQANFGLVNPDGSSYGWDTDGYGFVQVFANGTLIHDYSVFKPHAYSSNLTEHGYTFTVQANTNYYIKAWSVIAYSYYQCYSSVSISDVCTAANSYGNGCDCCTSIGGC